MFVLLNIVSCQTWCSPTSADVGGSEAEVWETLIEKVCYDTKEVNRTEDAGEAGAMTAVWGKSGQVWKGRRSSGSYRGHNSPPLPEWVILLCAFNRRSW